MSRFKGTYRPAPATAAAAVAPVSPSLPGVADPAPAPPPPAPSRAAEPTLGPTHRLGFFFLAAYLLSGVINGAIFRVVGSTTYLTAVCLVFLPVLILFNGRIMSALHVSVGKLWVLFAFWLLLDVPTSVWKGGSALVLWGYLPRSLMLYFYITSFVVTLTDNRRLMNINILGSFLLVVNCLAFGSMKSGRLEIPDSLFFENANDLGLALLLGVCQTAYLFFIPGLRSKIWGALVAFGSLFYMLKTGSRGCFVALLVSGFIAFLLSRQKVLFGALGTLALVLILIAMPGDLRSRLTYIISDSSNVTLTSEDEIASYGSQLQREQLLRQSLALTLQHPFFGVGPGEFAVAVYEDSKKENKHAPWLGTHNSYAQISSECGIPALLLYLGVIFWTLKTSLKIYRGTANKRGMQTVAGLAYSMFLGTVAFAFGTFFFHVAYSSFLPVLSGSVLALKGVVERENQRSFARVA